MIDSIHENTKGYRKNIRQIATELSRTNPRRQGFMRRALESSGLAAIFYLTDAIFEELWDFWVSVKWILSCIRRLKGCRKTICDKAERTIRIAAYTIYVRAFYIPKQINRMQFFKHIVFIVNCRCVAVRYTRKGWNNCCYNSTLCIFGLSILLNEYIQFICLHNFSLCFCN